MDFQASHDLEDFVAVLEGRADIDSEIEQSERDVRTYLAAAAANLLAESRFLDVLPGFVLDDGRVPMILERLSSITKGLR